MADIITSPATDADVARSHAHGAEPAAGNDVAEATTAPDPAKPAPRKRGRRMARPADSAEAPPASSAARATKATSPSLDRRRGKTASEVKATKSDAVIALLSRPKGTSLDEMMEATGWQAHSVRGFLSGTVKKKLGHELISEMVKDARVYRIVVAGK